MNFVYIQYKIFQLTKLNRIIILLATLYFLIEIYTKIFGWKIDWISWICYCNIKDWKCHSFL